MSLNIRREEAEERNITVSIFLELCNHHKRQIVLMVGMSSFENRETRHVSWLCSNSWNDIDNNTAEKCPIDITTKLSTDTMSTLYGKFNILSFVVQRRVYISPAAAPAERRNHFKFAQDLKRTLNQRLCQQLQLQLSGAVATCRKISWFEEKCNHICNKLTYQVTEWISWHVSFTHIPSCGDTWVTSLLFLHCQRLEGHPPWQFRHTFDSPLLGFSKASFAIGWPTDQPHGFLNTSAAHQVCCFVSQLLSMRYRRSGMGGTGRGRRLSAAKLT